LDINILWIALACFFGSILAALANMAQSGSPFQPAKFASALITGFIAGLVFAGAYKLSNPPSLNLYDVFVAIVAGFGTATGTIKILLHRELTALKKKLEYYTGQQKAVGQTAAPK
jgi:ABC-type thiamin/hydroxymethylpyrimidine transport system permease subunit